MTYRIRDDVGRTLRYHSANSTYTLALSGGEPIIGALWFVNRARDDWRTLNPMATDDLYFEEL